VGNAGAGNRDSSVDRTDAPLLDAADRSVSDGAMDVSADRLADSGPRDALQEPSCLVPTDCPGAVTECFAKQCITGRCSVAPKPAATLCNGLMDQCDGMGNCVDCVDNGGCGECCVCSQNHCIPAAPRR
jgi:hypothetical protein